LQGLEAVDRRLETGEIDRHLDAILADPGAGRGGRETRSERAVTIRSPTWQRRS